MDLPEIISDGIITASAISAGFALVAKSFADELCSSFATAAMRALPLNPATFEKVDETFRATFIQDCFHFSLTLYIYKL